MSEDSSETSFDLIRDAAAERLMAARERDPRSHPYGLFVQGMTEEDIPGLFVWYATHEARWDAIISDVAVAWADDAEEAADAAAAAQAVRTRHGGELSDAALDDVSDDIVVAVVIWAGTFDGLCLADHPFALITRGAFREPEPEESPEESGEKTLLLDEPPQDDHCGAHDHDCCDHEPQDPALQVPISPSEIEAFAAFLPQCG